VAQTWDLWIPDAASRGVSFARGVLEPSVTPTPVGTAAGCARPS
jgi:hypothetical protein